MFWAIRFRRETTMGPMAHRRFADEARAQVGEAWPPVRLELMDAKRFADDGGTYLAPQILTDVTHDMRVMRDETFGPVVGIMKVGDDRRSDPADQ